MSDKPGKSFEAEIESIFKLLGYETHRNLEIDGNDIDIYAEIDSGIVKQRVAVECKDLSNNVSVEEVNKFCSIFVTLRAINKIDTGIVVARMGFSPNALNKAQSLGVTCLSYTDLMARLLDFMPYLRKFVYDYENFQEYTSGQRKPIVEIMQRCDLHSFYVDLRCFDMYGNVYNPIDRFLEDWLKDPSRNHLSILGDYGTGKSSFCLQLAYKLAKNYLKDPISNRIPVFISLRDYATAVNAQQLVTDLLLNQYGIHLPNYVVFQKVLESGKLVLILDGFDEMATKVDKRITLRNFEELSKLVVPNSKTILTCRTHYFKSHTHALELLSTSEQTELMKSILRRPNFEIIELLDFDESQIIMLLKRHTKNWSEYWRHIQRTYNLEDLAKRPILLDMIIKTLPQLIAAGREVDAALLYDEYTKFWIEREDWHSVMTKQGKAIFMEELASLMYLNEGKEWINYCELPRPIKEHFRHEILTSEDLDYYDHDTRACSFLNRDREGNYKFIHRSFMEFFVAKRLVKQVEEGRSIGIREKMLPPVISGFIEKLLNRRDKLWQMIESTKGRAFQQTKYIGGNAATILNKIGESFAKKDLSNTVLQNADLSGANLEKANFSEADLQAVAFDYAHLNGVNFKGANLKGTTFSDIPIIQSLAIDPEGKMIAVGGSMGNVYIFRIADTQLIKTLKFQAGSIKLCFNPQGSCIVIGDNNGKFVIFDLRVETALMSIEAHKAKIVGIAYSPNGRTIALASEDGRGSVWEVRNGRRVFEIHGHEKCVNSVCYSPNGKLVASGGDDMHVRIWDADTGVLQKILKLNHTCWALCFSQDNNILFSAGGSVISGYTFPVSAWNWDKELLLASIPLHRQVIYAMKTLPEETGIVSFSQDGRIMTWRLSSTQPTLLFESDNALWAGDVSLFNKIVAGGDYCGRLIALSLVDGMILCDISTALNCKGMDITNSKGLTSEVINFLKKRGATS